MYKAISISFSLLLYSTIGCNPTGEDSHTGFNEGISENLPGTFAEYWFDGRAEINQYRLRQARYGEYHEGLSTLIFVTEDFLIHKHVKYEGHDTAALRGTVLKLNMTRNFQTGVYPYSLMASVFSSLNYEKNPHAFKITTSAQDWCGQSYLQFNTINNKTSYQLRSYFENESDQNGQFSSVWQEDELFNYIRFAPHKLPKGAIRLLPASFYLRLAHLPVVSQLANATLSTVGDSIHYTISYTSIERIVRFKFEKNFPYRILAWEETYNERGKSMKTEATLEKSIRLDYWNKNKPKDSLLLQQIRSDNTVNNW